MTTFVLPNRADVIAGAAAGGVLSVALALLDEQELAPVEWMAFSLAVIGLALTARARASAGTYWFISALAGIPAVLSWWIRRSVDERQELSLTGRAIAERDYRAEVSRRPRRETPPFHTDD
ncbi:MAG: hypothetical protein HC828_03640 [Blastochloris sp.]|nr:hypothetical protein [Blastochloris sp.]